MPLRAAWIKFRHFAVYRILHIDDSPHRIALGVAIAIFVAATPALGLHMILTVVIAAALRANKFVGLPVVWINNPFTIVPIHYFEWQVGRLVTRSAPVGNSAAKAALSGMLSSYDNFIKALLKVGIEVWVGSLIVGLVGGALSYWITRRLLERYRARRKDRKRRMSNHGKRAAHKLILASKSPRRAQLLRQAGYEFSVVAAPVAEPSADQAHLPPPMQAEALSYFKARASATLCNDGIILAADTVVALGDRVFGKPENADDARRILGALAGTTHRVITGVTIFEPATGRRKITHDVSRVRMRKLTDSQLSRYIASGNWQGKAGAYGIQDRDDPFVERLEGSFSNVVGLPLELVGKLLTEFDCRPSTAGRSIGKA